MSEDPSKITQIQKPGHIAIAFASTVQAQLQVAQAQAEATVAMNDASAINRPGYIKALQGLAAAALQLAQAEQTLGPLISRPLG